MEQTILHSMSFQFTTHSAIHFSPPPSVQQAAAQALFPVSSEENENIRHFIPRQFSSIRGGNTYTTESVSIISAGNDFLEEM